MDCHVRVPVIAEDERVTDQTQENHSSKDWSNILSLLRGARCALFLPSRPCPTRVASAGGPGGCLPAPRGHEQTHFSLLPIK